MKTKSILILILGAMAAMAFPACESERRTVTTTTTEETTAPVVPATTTTETHTVRAY